jgi:hypothetical protein
MKTVIKAQRAETASNAPGAVPSAMVAAAENTRHFLNRSKSLLPVYARSRLMLEFPNLFASLLPECPTHIINR